MTDDVRHPDDVVLMSACFPEINGMRYNGHRWVSADSMDCKRAVIPSERGEYFVGIEKRKPPRRPSCAPKTRRRGPGRSP